MGQVEGIVAVIDVRHFPQLGQEVAARTGVRHESPQVIVLRDGAVMWTAHHGQITADALQRAMAALR